MLRYLFPNIGLPIRLEVSAGGKDGNASFQRQSECGKGQVPHASWGYNSSGALLINESAVPKCHHTSVTFWGLVQFPLGTGGIRSFN